MTNRWTLMAKITAVVALTLLAAHWSLQPNIATATTTTPRGVATDIVGDTDCNGVVQGADALPVLAFAADVPIAAGCFDARADVNCDNYADVLDALRILLHASGNSVPAVEDCTPIAGEFVGGEIPSSADLIDAAVEASELDPGTAIVYKVFATFGDDRLPAEYKGTDQAVPLSYALADASLAYDSLSPANKALVDLFLLPPGDENSWYAQQHAVGPSGVTQPAAALGLFHTPYVRSISLDHLGFPQNVQVRILTALTLQPSTSEVMANLVQTYLPVAVNLYGRLPKVPTGGTLDIYVMPDLAVNTTFGWVEPNTNCDYEPVWLAIDSDILTAAQPQMFAGGSLGQQTQAMMHALGLPEVMNFEMQFCIFNNSLGDNQRFLLESFQALSEHAASPLLNSEHVWKDAFKFPTQSMLTPKFGYSYWPMLAQIQQQNPFAMQSIWAATEANSSALKALNSGVPGGISPYFRGFGKSIWNRPPITTLQTLDGIKDAVRQSGTTGGFGGYPQLIRLDGQKSFKYKSLDALVNPFSSRHYNFVVTGSNVKSVQVNNLLYGRENAGLEVLVKTQGNDWEEEDWTEEQGKSFCFNNPDEHLEQIVLIYTLSNIFFLDPVPLPNVPILEARDSCGWTGSGSVNRTLSVGGGGRDGELRLDAIFDDLVFSSIPAPDGSTAAGEYFELKSGTITWTVSGSYTYGFGQGTCIYSGGGALELEEGEGLLRVLAVDDGVEYAIYGYSGGQYPLNQECDDDEGLDEEAATGIWVCSGGAQTSGSADVIDGSFNFSASGNSPPACHVSTPAAQPQGAQQSTRLYAWHLTRS